MKIIDFSKFLNHPGIGAIIMLKSMPNDQNSSKTDSGNVPQPQDTPSNVPEPSRIDWSSQTGPRAEISKIT